MGLPSTEICLFIPPATHCYKRDLYNWHAACSYPSTQSHLVAWFKEKRSKKMVLSLDNVLGIHAQALSLYSQRSSVLAANLANADTPNYKAKDIDFKSILSRAADKKSEPTQLTATQAGHFGNTAASSHFAADRLYRQPDQPSLDGNTVEVQKEQAAFSDNSMRYMATLRFVTGRVQGIMTALRGE